MSITTEAPLSLALPTSMVLIVDTGEAGYLENLRQGCGRWGAVQVATLLRQAVGSVRNDSPAVIMVAGRPGSAHTMWLIGHLHSLSPETTMLIYTNEKHVEDGDWSSLGVFGVLQSGVTIQELHRWLRAASEQTALRRLLARAQGRTTALQALAEDLHRATSVDDIAEVGLSAAITLVGGALPDANAAALAGAVLLVGDHGLLTVRTAEGRFRPNIDMPLPVAQQALALDAMQRREMIAERDACALPLMWGETARGVLLLQGATLNADAAGLARTVAHQLSASLENALLFDLATVDSTTRIYTRVFAQQRLHEALKLAHRTGQDITVLMMDLDHFKRVNDTYGHLIGDRLLHQAAGVLRDALRDSDVLGRYGGDEFIAVLPNTPGAGGIEVARRIVQRIARLKLEVAGTQVGVGISVGAATIGGQQAGARPSRERFEFAAERIVAQADEQLYQAKRGAEHVAAAPTIEWSALLAEAPVAQSLMPEIR
jgi:diguanylate cyclase (GGDEF)-like protein